MLHRYAYLDGICIPTVPGGGGMHSPSQSSSRGGAANPNRPQPTFSLRKVVRKKCVRVGITTHKAPATHCVPRAARATPRASRSRLRGFFFFPLREMVSPSSRPPQQFPPPTDLEAEYEEHAKTFARDLEEHLGNKAGASFAFSPTPDPRSHALGSASVSTLVFSSSIRF